mmetsp:Transcript_108281/g.338735  ORF Transcript_108281/g.338735 Transcript_108281/m.338735 type:complete len:231 (+) Transcript_108281:1646-2338(+)
MLLLAAPASAALPALLGLRLGRRVPAGAPPVAAGVVLRRGSLVARARALLHRHPEHGVHWPIARHLPTGDGRHFRAALRVVAPDLVTADLWAEPPARAGGAVTLVPEVQHDFRLARLRVLPVHRPAVIRGGQRVVAAHDGANNSVHASAHRDAGGIPDLCARWRQGHLRALLQLLKGPRELLALHAGLAARRGEGARGPRPLLLAQVHGLRAGSLPRANHLFWPPTAPRP